MYLGIEIGGTKLQLGLGPGDGTIAHFWRGTVNPEGGAAGIRQQIRAAIPELLRTARVAQTRLKAAGIGFGGPVDIESGRIIKSHQINGWDNFPIHDWLADLLKVPVALGNDADVAGLAEALYGAGQSLSPIFYITIGSGIGGGLIIDGGIYRGAGKGAAEIGHLRYAGQTIEEWSSGWGIARQARDLLMSPEKHQSSLRSRKIDEVTAADVAEEAKRGDVLAQGILDGAISFLAWSIGTVITLLCPRRIVIGGGVSLIGDEQFFEPLRSKVASSVFPPFAGLTDIVPAALGEAVVVHGALALAKSIDKP